MNINGVVNVHKEAGMTSRDVVNVMSKFYGIKAGHTGTLDPMATGVLPICLGKSTKIADRITAKDKTYIARVIFGSTTDTLDSEGEITQTLPFNADLEQVRAALQQFIGEIAQVPPMYSALRYNGRRLYELAREGQTLELQPRNVTIFKLELMEHSLPQYIDIYVECSKGTYIRSLCRDIGEALGSCAHMGSLVRTKSGQFLLEDALTLGQITEHQNPLDLILPPEKVLLDFKRIQLPRAVQGALENGNPIESRFWSRSIEFEQDKEILVFDYKNRLVGIYVFDEKDGAQVLKTRKHLL